MFTLACFSLLLSPIALIAGLINPRWVLLGENRTRRKSSAVYSGAFVASLLIAAMTAPPQAKQANQPSPQPTQESSVLSPSPSPSTAVSPSPKPQPESVASTEPTNPSHLLEKEKTAPISKKVSKETASLSASKADTELPAEVVLTASDPKSQINLRAIPSASGKREGYGLVGDRVEVIDQTTAEGYDWYKVRFSKSGSKGWIRGDFVSVDGTNQQPATSATNPPNTSPESPANNCDPSYPDMCLEPGAADLDCPDISQKNFTVRQPDPHGFDRDQDGVGCES